MLFKPALNYFFLFFDRSYCEKTVFFSLDYNSTSQRGRMEPPSAPWCASKEVSKSKTNGADLAKSNRKVLEKNMAKSWKKHGKVCPQCLVCPVLNAGIAGDTVEAILYRVEVMALIIYLQILLLLFLPQLQKFYFYYDESVQLQKIYLFPILPQFDHLKTHFATTNSFIYFQVQEFFSEFFFPRAAIHPK